MQALFLFDCSGNNDTYNDTLIRSASGSTSRVQARGHAHVSPSQGGLPRHELLLEYVGAKPGRAGRLLPDGAAADQRMNSPEASLGIRMQRDNIAVVIVPSLS